VKKKLVLSVLSTAVVASMASAAMAQVPGPGILVGGEVNKYYSLDAFLDDKYFDQALNEILDNQEDSYLVVDKNGNVAPLSQALFAKNKAELDAATRPASKADFNGKTFKYADSDDEWNSATDPDLPEPGELKVESVSAINLKQVEVKFSAAVDEDSATDVTKYSINGTPLVANSDVAELLEDGKTVRITLATPLVNETAKTLVVSKIKSADGSKETAIFSASVKYADATLPTVSSVEVRDSKTLRVYFSEPVYDAAGNDDDPAVADDLDIAPARFVVDGGSYVVASATAVPDKNAVDVVLSSDLVAGAHTIKVVPSSNTLTDYAGYAPLTAEKSFTFDGDTVAPTVTVKSATETSVTLKFSEPVKNVNNANVIFRHTYDNTNNEVNGTAATVVPGTNNTEWKVNFGSTKPFPPGTVKLYIKYTNPSGTVITDNFGNKMAATTLDVTVTNDTTAPTVQSVSYVDSTHVDVTFSEAVTGATTLTNYELTDAEGNPVSVTNAVLQSGNTYRLTTAALTGGTYSLKIQGIKDTSLAQNALVTVTKTFVAPDKTAPTIKSVSLNSTATKVRIVFSEPMSDAGLTDVANYQLQIDGGSAAALPAGSSVTKIDSKTVEITFPSAPANLDGTTDNILVSGALKDANGNAIGGFFTTAAITTDAVAVVANSLKVLDKNTIEFRVNRTVTAVDASKFVDNDGNFTFARVSASNDMAKGQGIITITTNEDIPTDLSGTTFDIRVGSGGITTSLGYTGSTITSGLTSANAKDYVAADITSNGITTKDTDKDGQIDAIDIVYTENLQQSSVTASDYTVEGYTIKDVVVSGATVTLILNESGTPDTDATPKVTQVGTVNDASAQHNTTAAKAAITAVDAAAPVLVKAVVQDAGTLGFGNDAGDKLVLTFSEAVNTGFATATAPTDAELDAIFAGISFAGTTPVFSANDLSAATGTAGKTLTITLVSGSLTTNIVANDVISTAATPTAGAIVDGEGTDIAGAQADVTVE